MRRRAWAISAIIVLVIAVAAYSAVAYWQNHNSPLSKCEREASAGDSQVFYGVLQGVLVVTPGSSRGNLTITVRTDGCAPFSGLAITSVQPALGGLVNQPFLRYDGVIIDTAHPVPTDVSEVSGSIGVSNAMTNQTYTMNVETIYGTSGQGLMVSSHTMVLTSQP
jgi:hypothetical protein